MPNQNPPLDHIDSYLEKLEAQEKKSRRNRFLLLTTLAVAALGGAGMYTTQGWKKIAFPEPPKPIQVMHFDSVQPDYVPQMLAGDPRGFVVTHELVEMPDTIKTQQAFFDFQNKIDMVKISMEEFAEAQSDTIPAFKVKVSGKKQVRSTLTYTIENYQPEFDLTLDFGNGVIRKPSGESYSYRYPKPGHFDMHLILNHGDSTEIIETLKYEIKAKQDT
ncbi:hypothetical protein [Pontibacter sp. G13]|uniref:hypothetical protein n=1 Tax=Pontibacter sp. G13 TaxID=3074898 RepID=UPI00288BEC5D|nr:hypothetical protein [Pontibacter sp. G13]WNJ16892.1 hypothetical protein RJD25_18665 [Pontibacter sp. G13]